MASHTEITSLTMQSDRIGQTIGPYDDILTTVKKRRLKWFGHVSRSLGLPRQLYKEQCKEGEGADKRSVGQG